MDPLPSTPATQPSTQAWAAILTALAGAIAVVAKKRFTRTKSASLDTRHSSLLAKLDANHKELLAAVATQGTAIEKRLDALESTVARLDERTKLHS